MLLRRSTSLRQGLPNVGVSHGRRKSSLEEIGISHFTTLMQATNHTNPIKIALNGSIGLEVNVAHTLRNIPNYFVTFISSHKNEKESDFLTNNTPRRAYSYSWRTFYSSEQWAKQWYQPF